jgi:hypothetical protein
MKKLAAPLLAVLALSGGCLTDQDARESERRVTETFEESEADTVLEYDLVDFAFRGPTTAKGPNVLLRARNTGTQEHELEVLDGAGDAVGEIEAFAPGGSPEPLAAVLEPGNYTLQCLVETEDGKVHTDLGMVATLTVE